ncbi:MAG: IclR family transcriptional regulator, partial [Christensenellaceae bacterium]|nr:IclR family transcriptional regulator [Christensenellaceae bacterium]
YHLGPKVLEFSNHFYQNNDIRKIIRPAAEELAEEFGETIYIAKLFDSHVIYIDAIYPKSNMGGRNVIGIQADTYCTGVGKSLLAYQDQNIIDDIIKKGLKPYTKNTITNSEVLNEELEEIRKRGYAIDNMEHEHGIKCVAVPLFNVTGEVVAAMSISGPSLRFGDKEIEKFTKTLVEISKKYSSLIM